MGWKILVCLEGRYSWFRSYAHSSWQKSLLGKVPAHNIARWDGRQWWSLGDGIPDEGGVVKAIAVSENGDVYAGGLFTNATGVAVASIAKWDGRNWSPLNDGIRLLSGIRGNVSALALAGNELYVGGYFEYTGKVSSPHLAKWNISTNQWSAIRNGRANGIPGNVRAIAASGKDVYVGGELYSAGTVRVNNIARWDGKKWSGLGSGVGGRVNAIFIDGNNIYVAGDFSAAGGVAADKIAKWDGRKWSGIGGGVPSDYSGQEVSTIAALNDDVYVGGNFSEIGNPINKISNFAKWDGRDWSVVGGKVNQPVLAMTVAGENIFIAGWFAKIGNLNANGVAKWDGKNWSTISSSRNAAKSIELSASSFIVAERGEQIPTEFELLQNYPNPFNPTTLIRFGLPQDAGVKLEILNLAGRHVVTLLNARQAAGYHDVEFNAGDLASGAYFYRLTAGNFSAMKKLMLVR